MTVDEFSQRLASGKVEFVEDGYYRNELGRIGYWAIHRDGVQFYWYSVSASENEVPINEVVRAIESPTRKVVRAKPYWNANRQRGFEATVYAEDHWFMLGAAPDPPLYLWLRSAQ